MKAVYEILALIIILTTLFLVSCNKTEVEYANFPDPQTCPGIPEVDYGGIIYPTVKIGEQCWLAKSLNIGTMIPHDAHATDNNIIEKHCYNDDTANCSANGGYYQWDELMQYTKNEGTQGICPQGWHIPTNKELAKLFIYIGCNQSYISEGGKNSTGMNLLRSGIVGSFGSAFWEKRGYYWTSKELSDSESLNFLIGVYAYDLTTNPIHKKNACSVRCIKDE